MIWTLITIYKFPSDINCKSQRPNHQNQVSDKNSLEEPLNSDFKIAKLSESSFHFNIIRNIIRKKVKTVGWSYFGFQNWEFVVRKTDKMVKFTVLENNRSSLNISISIDFQRSWPYIFGLVQGSTYHPIRGPFCPHWSKNFNCFWFWSGPVRGFNV